jgi:hypothetical protein
MGRGFAHAVMRQHYSKVRVKKKQEASLEGFIQLMGAPLTKQAAVRTEAGRARESATAREDDSLFMSLEEEGLWMHVGSEPWLLESSPQQVQKFLLYSTIFFQTQEFSFFFEPKNLYAAATCRSRGCGEPL